MTNADREANEKSISNSAALSSVTDQIASVRNADPLLVDDIDAALAHLTDLGRLVAGPCAALVKDSLTLFAITRSWAIVRHRAFSAWVPRACPPTEAVIVLDPLLPDLFERERVIPFRCSRSLGAEGLRIRATFSPESHAQIKSCKVVTVVDDVVLTGSTLRYATDFVVQAGGVVGRYVACAASELARLQMAALSPGATWVQFALGNHRCIHFRDACPLLPFAGKRTDATSPIDTENGPVPVCVPPMVFRGGLWEEVAANRAVQGTIRSASRQAAQTFSRVLGRSATVSDIPLLGQDVALSLLPSQHANAETPLERLFS